jgi:hypothetical protein
MSNLGVKTDTVLVFIQYKLYNINRRGYIFMSKTATNLKNTTDLLEQTTQAIFNVKSITVLILALIFGIFIGRIITRVIVSASNGIGRQADETTNLDTVNRLRRIETLLVLSTALVRTIFIVLGLIAWWAFTHPAEKPTALIGAGALIALLLNGVFSPMLRDVAFGGGMMAEQWFGVGDLINVMPFDTLGVVEKITLRSTRIRALNGDVVWITNQNIAGAQVVYRGARAVALEIFASDYSKVEKLIEETNLLLPIGPSLLISPLSIMSEQQIKSNIWRILVVGETSPGREELIRENATTILTKIDKKKYKTLLTEPIARYADIKAERKFGKAINNARKTNRQKPNRLKQLNSSIKTKSTTSKVKKS